MTMITEAFLRSIKPQRGRPTKVIPDGRVPGLSIRYGARGVVEFTLVHRWGKDMHQYRRHVAFWWDDDLGPPPSDRWLPLDQARLRAMQLRERAIAGDPMMLADYFTATGPLPPGDMVNAVLARYAKEELSRLKTARQYEQLLRTALGADRRIGEVTRQDIRRVLDGHIKAAHGFMANRCHQALGTFFRWCLDRDLIDINPVAGMARPMRREPSRDRVLNDRELSAIWHMADTLTVDRRDAIRFLMITGLRRGDVVGLLWTDIADGTLTIRDPKNNMAHTVPLSPQALQLLRGRSLLQSGSGVPLCNKGLVFGTKLGNLSNYGAVLRSRLPDIPNWRLHDFRRSMASTMQDLGIQPVVIDKCLGHSNVIKGIAAVYLRGQYLPERRSALLLWGDHVAKLVSRVE